MQRLKNVLIALVTGVLMSLAALGVSVVASSIAPSIGAEYLNPSMFRSWQDPLMNIFWIAPFFSALVLMWLWFYIRPVVRGSTFLRRGLSFGFTYWFITLPGMVMTYSSFCVSFGIVLSWSLTGLAQAVLAGIVYARWRP